jgi:hypothetical protein
MKKKAVLVNLERLRKLIAGLELGDEKLNDCIDARWINYIEWWDSRSRDAKLKYQRLRGAVVIAGALIPALVGLRELNVWVKYNWVFAVASIIASLVVAICAGLESLYNYGGIWREKRAAAELIKSEGFSFLQLAGEYKQHKTHALAFQQFATNVENLIRSEIKDYIAVATPKESDNRIKAAQDQSLLHPKSPE